MSLRKTVKELLSSLDSWELTYWLAFHSVEPVTAERSDLASAIVASTIARCYGNKLGPDKFMVDWWKDRKQQTPVEFVKAYFIALAKRSQ